MTRVVQQKLPFWSFLDAGPDGGPVGERRSRAGIVSALFLGAEDEEGAFFQAFLDNWAKEGAIVVWEVGLVGGKRQSGTDICE